MSSVLLANNFVNATLNKAYREAWLLMVSHKSQPEHRNNNKMHSQTIYVIYWSITRILSSR